MPNTDEKSQTDLKKHGTRANMAYVLKADLDATINTAVESIQASIQTSLIENLRPVNEALARLETNVSKNSLLLAQQGDEIIFLKSENVKLQQTIEDLAERIGNLETAPACSQTHLPETNDILKEIDSVKERLEERTNRQLRQTIVVKGVKEQPKETWEITKQLLASTIAENVNTSYSNAYQLLNRVHRGRPTDDPHKRGQRDIYANIYSWAHCERLVQDFRSLNVRGQTNVRIEYKYGPLTTNRRLQAMGRRKEMKTAGSLISGYVAYPARLMVKVTGSTVYKMVEDFSCAPYKVFKPRTPSASVQDGEHLLSADGDISEPTLQSGWSNSNLNI